MISPNSQAGWRFSGAGGTAASVISAKQQIKPVRQQPNVRVSFIVEIDSEPSVQRTMILIMIGWNSSRLSGKSEGSCILRSCLSPARSGQQSATQVTEKVPEPDLCKQGWNESTFGKDHK